MAGASGTAAEAELERRVQEAAYRAFLRASLMEGGFLTRSCVGYRNALASCHTGSTGFTW